MNKQKIAELRAGLETGFIHLKIQIKAECNAGMFICR